MDAQPEHGHAIRSCAHSRRTHWRPFPNPHPARPARSGIDPATGIPVPANRSRRPASARRRERYCSLFSAPEFLRQARIQLSGARSERPPSGRLQFRPNRQFNGKIHLLGHPAARRARAPTSPICSDFSPPARQLDQRVHRQLAPHLQLAILPALSAISSAATAPRTALLLEIAQNFRATRGSPATIGTRSTGVRLR